MSDPNKMNSNNDAEPTAKTGWEDVADYAESGEKSPTETLTDLGLSPELAGNDRVLNALKCVTDEDGVIDTGNIKIGDDGLSVYIGGKTLRTEKDHDTTQLTDQRTGEIFYGSQDRELRKEDYKFKLHSDGTLSREHGRHRTFTREMFKADPNKKPIISRYASSEKQNTIFDAKGNAIRQNTEVHEGDYKTMGESNEPARNFADIEDYLPESYSIYQERINDDEQKVTITQNWKRDETKPTVEQVPQIEYRTDIDHARDDNLDGKELFGHISIN